MPYAKKKLLRISTIPLSLKMFCSELLSELRDEYDVLAVSSSGKELDDLRARGIPVTTVEMQRSISPLHDLRSLWQLYKLLRSERPYIVHSMTPKAGLLAMMAARAAGVPIRIHSFTGLLFPTATGLKRAILKTTDRITCLCATHILPEGEGVKTDLIKGRITRKPLEVLGNGNLRGIDLSHYKSDESVTAKAQEIANSMGIDRSRYTFIFVGRIVRDKGMAELIEAFSRLTSESIPVNLILVGMEEPAEDPLTPSTSLSIKQNPYIYTTDSWVDDIRPYYTLADALAFPSYREGFPNVVLEAGAMGLPSIVTDINGSREIIKPGINGDIIATHDAEALYQAMKKYATEPAYVTSLASNCRRMIAERYEARFVRECIKKYYQRLTAKDKEKKQ